MTDEISRQNLIQTNPWLNHPLNSSPNPAPSASFVEYLRWMRIRRENPRNNSQIGLVNNGEVIELLQKLESRSDYSSRLDILTKRTRSLATVCFEVKTSWRIRVGGMKGPESMLLPAFDALGMPYIPSTTLKGAAREMAQRDLKADANKFQEKIRPIFGNLAPDICFKEIFGDLEPTACMGKVVFLDAYPLPFPRQNRNSDDEAEGLVPDMANSIWTWDNNTPSYKANPNTFLSLRKSTFVIGLRVTDDKYLPLLELVKKWLLTGLAQGIGSRVNSGYGVLEEILGADATPTQEIPEKEKLILEVGFQLRGQLIHGRQHFNAWQTKRDRPNEWKPPGNAQPEVRPPAIRSMLRYWFRTLGLGVLEPSLVRDWELTIFGGIEPQARMGMFQLEIPDGRVIRDNAEDDDDEYGLATGTLCLRQSHMMKELPKEQRTALKNLLASLTWLMFYLGSVGLGARRPCYSRQSRNFAPWWRGSSFVLTSEIKSWLCPPQLEILQKVFRTRLDTFYTSLATLTGEAFNPAHPQTLSNNGSWAEAIDGNCRILCIKGDIENKKPPALALLHREARQGNGYDRQLCGSMSERSPIWIARINNRFDVVTIFGVDNQRRKRYFELLQQPTSPVTDFREIWPFPPA